MILPILTSVCNSDGNSHWHIFKLSRNTDLKVKGGEISLKHFIYKTWIFIRTNALLINFNTKQTVGLISFKIILEIFTCR